MGIAIARSLYSTDYKLGMSSACFYISPNLSFRRKFPPAVYNRISGIMLDDTVSPWLSEPSVSSIDNPGLEQG
jgi:hypothetical protein